LLGVLTVVLRVRESTPRNASAHTASTAGPNAATTAIDATTGASAARWIPAPLRLPLLAIFLFALGNATDAFLLLRLSTLGVPPRGRHGTLPRQPALRATRGDGRAEGGGPARRRDGAPRHRAPDGRPAARATARRDGALGQRGGEAERARLAPQIVRHRRRD